MSAKCPSNAVSCSESGTVVRYGGFYRKSDCRLIQRYKCTHCGRHFSQATKSPCFGQNKRHLNYKIYLKFVSGYSQRRIARQLKIKTLTVARKLEFLGSQSRFINLKMRRNRPLISELQFDDLETFEHTKLKPLSVTLAVEKHSRFIVGFEVSRMPAKGLLIYKSLKKYGPRKDERSEARDRLFRRIHEGVSKKSLIESDQNPHYPQVVKKYFPEANYQTLKGQRGCVTGQGELKQVHFDPLFSLNHTCAMLRANINRLFRKTWCTTKKIQPLIDHIEIYVRYHNQILIENPST